MVIIVRCVDTRNDMIGFYSILFYSIQLVIQSESASELNKIELITNTGLGCVFFFSPTYYNMIYTSSSEITQESMPTQHNT